MITLKIRPPVSIFRKEIYCFRRLAGLIHHGRVRIPVEDGMYRIIDV
jgi:hypothetical protein